MNIESIDELIAKYSEDGNPEAAIAQQDLESFSLMRKYPDGLPTLVTVNALDKGIDNVSQFLAQMIIDTRGEVDQWDDRQKAEQMYLARVFMRLLRGEAWIGALRESMPEQGETEEQ
jgi:hypothetical protein